MTYLYRGVQTGREYSWAVLPAQDAGGVATRDSLGKPVTHFVWNGETVLQCNADLSMARGVVSSSDDPYSPGVTPSLWEAWNPPLATVTGVTPSALPAAGGSVTITGSGFSFTTAIVIGGFVLLLTGWTTAGDGLLTFTVPSLPPGSYDIQVVTDAGLSSTNSGDVVQISGGGGTGPAVTDVTPAQGLAAGGYTVTVNGVGLTEASDVALVPSSGATLHATPMVLSDRTLQFVMPSLAANPVTYDALVTTPLGTSAVSPGDKFVPLTPEIISLNPAVGLTGGGDTVVINGDSLDAVTSVTFDGVAATITAQSSMRITVTTPAHAAAAVDVAVITPSGTATATGAFTYETTPPTLSVTSVSPQFFNPAGGQTFTVIGVDLTGTSAVQLKQGATTLNCTGVTNVDSATVTAVTPAMVDGTVYDLVVTATAGTATLSTAVTAATPKVRTVNPGAGVLGQTSTVAVAGTGFASGGTVNLVNFIGASKATTDHHGVFAFATSGSGVATNWNGDAATDRAFASFTGLHGISVRMKWADMDGNYANTGGGTYTAFGNAVTRYGTPHGVETAVRFMAGTRCPVSGGNLFGDAACYKFTCTQKNANQPAPLPWNPNTSNASNTSTSFHANAAFETYFQNEITNLMTWADAHGVTLVHLPWYGGLWSEVYCGVEMANAGGWSFYNWLEGNLRLVNIAWTVAAAHPNITIEFPLTGIAGGQAVAIPGSSATVTQSIMTTALINGVNATNNPGHLPQPNATAYPLSTGGIVGIVGTNSPRFVLNANNFDDSAGVGATNYPANLRHAKQMVGTSNTYNWTTVYNKLLSSASVYLEAFSENFAAGAGNTNAALQTLITNFGTGTSGGTTTTPGTGLTVLSDTALVITAPASLTGALYDLQVVNPQTGSSPLGAADQFTIISPKLPLQGLTDRGPSPTGHNVPPSGWASVTTSIVSNMTWAEVQPTAFGPLVGCYDPATQAPGQGSNEIESAIADVRSYNGTYTLLAADMTAGQTTLKLVASGAAPLYQGTPPYGVSVWPTAGTFYIQIDSEIMQVTGGQGTPTLQVRRAQLGTQAAAHSGNSSNTTAVLAGPSLLTLKLRLFCGAYAPSTAAGGGTTGSVAPTGLSVTLGAAVSSTTATSWTVSAGGAVLPKTPFTLTVDSEQVTVTAISGATWTVTRHVNGTTAATHLNGATAWIIKPMPALWQDTFSSPTWTGWVPRWWTSGQYAAYLDLQTRLASLYDGLPELLDVTISMCMTHFAESCQHQIPATAADLTLLHTMESDPGDLSPMFGGSITIAGVAVSNADIQSQLNSYRAHAVWKATHSSCAYNPYQAYTGAGTAQVVNGVVGYLISNGTTGLRDVLSTLGVIENNNGEDNLSPGGACPASVGLPNPSSHPDARSPIIDAYFLPAGPPYTIQTAVSGKLANGAQPTATCTLINLLEWLANPSYPNGNGLKANAVEMPGGWNSAGSWQLTQAQYQGYDTQLTNNPTH